MKFAVIICAVVAAVTASPLTPVYSSRYATVYHQGALDKQTPQSEYGPPSQEESTTGGAETATERESEQIKDGENDAVNDKLTESSEVKGLKEEAVYYIYHPGGVLQKVVYLARDDPQNMAYTAQLKYENVEPIKEPIYTYNPETFELQELQF